MDWFFGYLLLNMILSLAALLAYLLNIYTRITPFQIPSRQALRIHLVLVALCFAVPPACQLLADYAPFQVPLSQSFDPVAQRMSVLSSDSLTFQRIQERVPLAQTSVRYELLFLCFFILLLGRRGMQISQTLFLLRRSFTWKSHGHISVVLTDELSVPFAFSYLQRSYSCIPISFLKDPDLFQVTLQHEFQHIRNKDTASIYLVELIKILCFWNPIVQLWMKNIETLQEYVCDEDLILEQGVPAKKYATCLFEAASLSEKPAKLPIGAKGIRFHEHKSQLFRRIERMKSIHQQKRGTWMTSMVATFAALAMSWTTLTIQAYASQGKYSIDEIKSIVKQSKFSKGFPITINEAVVDQLNRLTRSHSGKAFVKLALQNYEINAALFHSSINQYKLPDELLAVGFVESAFRNLPAANNSMRAAGIWQFIPQTARHYNLSVNEEVDERLDISLQTDAAMRYLQAMKLRFQDWQLALLSYNAGEGEVQKGIDQTGSRNAWHLIDAGFEGDSGYLAKVMAAAIVMRYPSLVN